VFPIGAADDGDEGGTGAVVFGHEEAAGGGRQLERLEESAADPGAWGAHGRGGRSDHEGVSGETTQRREDVLALGERPDHGIGEAVARRAGDGDAHLHELARLGDGRSSSAYSRLKMAVLPAITVRFSISHSE
jgi:hypothetical protein